MEARKNAHLLLAKEMPTIQNEFDLMKIEHHSLPKYDIKDINLSTHYLGHTFDYPFYINAMTGGTKESLEINRKLALVAKKFNIPFFLGSQSIALKDKQTEASFKIARESHDKGFICANLSANWQAKDAKKAIEMVNAQAIAIHLNPIQELTMVEGDRVFSHWKTNIQEILLNIKEPIIIKEVGFGMSKHTLEELKAMGVSHIDVSGQGGTNFAAIENKRASRNDGFLETLGISTVQSLLYANEVSFQTVLASGGIRHALDVVKALILGASAVGMSKFFLDRIELTTESLFKEVEELIEDIKKLMVLLNVSSVKALRKVAYKINSYAI